MLESKDGGDVKLIKPTSFAAILTILLSVTGIPVTYAWWMSLGHPMTGIALLYIIILSTLGAYPGLHVLILRNRFLALPGVALPVEFLMIGVYIHRRV